MEDVRDLRHSRLGCRYRRGQDATVRSNADNSKIDISVSLCRQVHRHHYHHHHHISTTTTTTIATTTMTGSIHGSL